jgi:hypothetical protein
LRPMAISKSKTLILSLAALCWTSGCVSQSTYEEAQSAADVEREAHRRVQARLQEVEQELSALQSDLERRESALDEQERRLAEADLHLKLAHRERDERGVLVDQLRGELARVGDHLRVFSEEKQRLAQELSTREDSVRDIARLRRLVGVVRDLTLLESRAIHSGMIELTSDGQHPLVRVPLATLAPGGKLGSDGLALAKSLASLAKLHPEASFVVSERAQADQALPDALVLRRVAEALTDQGIPAARVTLDVAEAAPKRARQGTSASGRSQARDTEVVFVIQLGATRAPLPESAPPQSELPSEPEADLGGPAAR